MVNELENQIRNELHVPKITIRKIYSTERKKEVYLDLLYKWIVKKQKKGEFFFEGKRVAIWGSGKYCSLLLNEFVSSEIEIKCIIESNPLMKEYMNLPIVRIQDMPKEVDSVIVIPYYEIEDIKKMIFEYHKNIRVIGIDELVNL